MNSSIKYMCAACDELHDDHKAAKECCQPRVSEVYLCGHCGENYGPNEDMADECCDDVDPDTQPIISQAVLEAHGQMRLSV